MTFRLQAFLPQHEQNVVFVLKTDSLDRLIEGLFIIILIRSQLKRGLYELIVYLLLLTLDVFVSAFCSCALSQPFGWTSQRQTVS